MNFVNNVDVSPDESGGAIDAVSAPGNLLRILVTDRIYREEARKALPCLTTPHWKVTLTLS